MSQSRTALSELGAESNGRYEGLHMIQLPSKDMTLQLFQTYLNYINHFQHIIFEPHTRQLIGDVYYKISHVSITTVPRGLALVCSILAISVLLGPFHGCLQSTLPTMRDRMKMCAVYIRAAMDCLEQARRRMDHTLENVQAMIILFFLINHIEAFSPRCRIILAEAITVARILSLHQIDATTSRRRPSNDEKDPIVREMKRRVWWYLVATDWMVSIAIGQKQYILTREEHC